MGKDHNYDNNQYDDSFDEEVIYYVEDENDDIDDDMIYYEESNEEDLEKK